MDYNKKYLKYKKKYLELSVKGGNFGVEPSGNLNDFTKNYFLDNLKDQTTVVITKYQDTFQMLTNNYYDLFYDKIQNLIFKCDENTVETLTILLDPNKFPKIIKLTLPYYINNTNFLINNNSGIPLNSINPLLFLPLNPLNNLNFTAIFQTNLNLLNNEIIIPNNNIIELIIEGKNNPRIGTNGWNSIKLIGNNFNNLKKLIIKGHCYNIMGGTHPNIRKFENFQVLEEIIFEGDYNNYINIENCPNLKSIIISNPQFREPLILKNLPKLEILEYPPNLNDVTLFNMGIFINKLIH